MYKTQIRQPVYVDIFWIHSEFQTAINIQVLTTLEYIHVVFDMS